MSNEANTELLELAADHIDYWTGTIWEQILINDLDSQDYDALTYHLLESSQEMAESEFRG